jgi:D-serine deaminase-like pyridoxal phosphate-dependent protein
MLPEQPFLCAALTVTRIISIPAPGLLCTDLGHKAIASENPIDRRVHFLNAPALQALRHSEEHLVLKSDGGNWKAGDVLYGVPFHICPTTALYDTLNAVEGGRVTATWKNRARDRRISV